jgi:hypothetical protein
MIFPSMILLPLRTSALSAISAFRECRSSLLLLLICSTAFSAPPPDFPTFAVPGHEKEMSTLRDLFWLHYPGAGPKSTLWDEWLIDAALWPAVTNSGDNFRNQWSNVLSSRIIDPEGYVATHQHASIAHQLGWPFPFWNQGRRGCGWHFSFKNTAPEGWRPHDLAKTNDWTFTSISPVGLTDDGWLLDLPGDASATEHALVVPKSDEGGSRITHYITCPAWLAHTFEIPFLQLRWQLSNCPPLEPFIEWTTPSATNFESSRRMYFEAPRSDQMAYTMIPMYRHPAWTGEIAQLRIGLQSAATPFTFHASRFTLQAFFSQYDTRHNINNQNFIRGCAKYFWWTHDLDFLRANINRMRTALRNLMVEHHTLERKAIYTTWVGHDGRTGIKRSADGKKEIITGEGIGNNYWDLLPFGNLDAYASIQYYDAVQTLAHLEHEIRTHPEWNIPTGALAFEADVLDHHAAEVKAKGNKLFWNNQTGRFVACIDGDGQSHDYGFTFLNCEAIYYDFASPDHAKTIMSWLDGQRAVRDDTSQRADIYHWRFAPRATTKRNLDWYYWAWSNPESIPWGGQVQDGGAVLGFSYHDLMGRLKTLGPENAWHRLREIIKWFDEIQAAGGYRKYYNGSHEGSLQGAGTPGGLGLDAEFFESVMVPQVMLKGFLGFTPRADGFELNPRLPSDWPELTVNNIRFQNMILKIRATSQAVEIQHEGETPDPCFAYFSGKRVDLDWQQSTIRLERH